MSLTEYSTYRAQVTLIRLSRKLCYARLISRIDTTSFYGIEEGVL